MSKAKNKQNYKQTVQKEQKPVAVAKKFIFDWKVFLVLGIFTFILYGNTLNNDYALDDAIVLTNNQFTQKGLDGIPDIFKYDTFVGFWLTSYKGKTAEQIQEEKKLVAGGRYRPLSLATFAIEVEYFGKNIKDANGQIVYKANPFVSHLVNILLYFFTVWILFLVLKRLFPIDKNKKWYLSLPFIVCLLFLAHPIHTEAVANVKGRDEIMTLLGSMSALWFTLKFLDTKKAFYVILSSVSLFLGLLSKENSITFLAIIPITVYYFTEHELKKNWKAFIWLFVSAGVFLLIRGSILGFGGHEEVAQEIMNNPFLHASGAEKMATIFFTLWVYIKLLIFPHPLTYDYYPHQIEIINWANPGAFLPFLLYLSIGIFAVYGLLKKKDVFSYSIWMYLIPLSVVSNIFFPVGTFINERFVFISSIGFCLIIAWLIYKYIPKLIKNLQSSQYVMLLILVVITGLYSFKTINRNKAWENDLTLFTTDVLVSSNSAKSNCSAGGKLIEEAQKPENKNNKPVHDDMCLKAISYLERAIEIYPEYVDALNLLGNAHYEYNFDIAKALHYYSKVLGLKKYHTVSYGNARIIMMNTVGLMSTGATQNTAEEIIHGCKEITSVQPEFGEAYHLIGTMYGKYLNDLNSAWYYFEKANSCKFEKNAAFYKDLGVVCGMTGKYKDALTYFLKAIELDPNDPQTYYNAGVTYQQLGDTKNAAAYITKSQDMSKTQQ